MVIENVLILLRATLKAYLGILESKLPIPVDAVRYVNELAEVGRAMSYTVDDVATDCVDSNE